jgi:hypothetical protein
VVAALLGLAVAGGALLVSGEETPVEADRTDAKLRTIAQQVEDLRGLEFERLPKTRKVTKKQLQEEAVKQQGQMTGKEMLDLEASGELMKLLGFLDQRADLTSAAPDTSDIAGTYEFDSKQLTIVRNVSKSQIPPEIVYAHELNHALEDQVFGLDSLTRGGDDAMQAKRALGEGSATFLEAMYAKRHLGADVSSREIATEDPASTEKGSTKKASYDENSERFVYLDGARFVARLYRKGGWKLVDRALEADPPTSTEQILHPDVYLDKERTAAIELDTKRLLSEDHKRLSAGQLGEFDTSQILLKGAKADDEITRKEAATAAEGWDGGRYELWQADDSSEECTQPCVEKDVLVLAWSWDSSEEVAEFVSLLPGYLERFQKLERAGTNRWRGDVVDAALSVTARETTLVLAPTPQLAQKLATSVRARP